MTRQKTNAPPKVPRKLAHLGDADYHTHSMKHLEREGTSKYTLYRHMLDLFNQGAKDQALTEHSYDFNRLNVGFQEYRSWFLEASEKIQIGHRKTSKLGMELNGIIKDGKPQLELETICDPTGLEAKDIIPHLDFAIVSVHGAYYDRTGTKIISEIKSNQEFFDCSCLVIQDCERLRQYKPTLPIILGHPGKDAIKSGVLPFTGEQATSLALLLYTHHIFPEINTSELKKFKESMRRKNSPYFKGSSFRIHFYDPLFLIRKYIEVGIKNNEVPLISIGSDSHTLEDTGRINLSTLSPYRKILSKAHLWSRKPDLSRSLNPS